MLEKLPAGLGHALRSQRAGLDKIAFNVVPSGPGSGAIEVTSLAFADHAPIPARYTADDAAVSPPLEWQGVPGEAAELVILVEDADAPTPRPLVHAIVVGLPAGSSSLPEGALKSPDHAGSDVPTGRNSYLQAGWLAPDPPPGHGPHRYAFQVFALAAGPAWSDTPGREEVLDAIGERGIASGCLIGTYERNDGTVRIGGTDPALA